MPINNKEYEEFSIKLTTEYLSLYPEEANKSKKTKEQQTNNIKKAFAKKIMPTKPTTQPDELVSIILEDVYGHEVEDRKKIQIQYLNQKQVEMKIGSLLEWYIAKEGHKYGWAFTGECIAAVDFLKKEGGKWTTLQIKNSYNTENSSASAIRNNTTILHWYRRKPKGLYNWDAFPDKNLKKILSEKGFRSFVKVNFKFN